jgi:hypothetical protein
VIFSKARSGGTVIVVVVVNIGPGLHRDLRWRPKLKRLAQVLLVLRLISATGLLLLLPILL